MDFFAFYWTFPVPWASFTALPDDPDEAAKRSRTIHYQVQRVRHWVADQKGRLVGEEVFLELQPDRGTEHVGPAVEKLIAKARAKSAGIVAVNFAESMGWRPHQALWSRLQGSGRVTALDPSPLILAGETLDPVAHFRAWRQLERLHSAGKEGRKAELIEVIVALRDQGMSYAAIAAALNEDGRSTANGKSWTADNVRKLVQG